MSGLIDGIPSGFMVALPKGCHMSRSQVCVPTRSGFIRDFSSTQYEEFCLTPGDITPGTVELRYGALWGMIAATHEPT